MDDLIVFGDSHSSALRHEVGVALPDEAAYIERQGRRYVLAGTFEVPRLRSADPSLEVITFEDLGITDSLSEGKSAANAVRDALVRGCSQIGIETALVPDDFPLVAAEALRHAGISLRVDSDFFIERRRVKSEGELEGIRRAQRAGEAALEAICDRIRAEGDVDAAELRALAWGAFAANAALPHDMLIIACGVQSALPHEEGSGPMNANEPIVIDIFPRDIVSGCWGDLTRTVCVGEAPDWLRRCHTDVREAQRLATEKVKPGVTGAELNRIAAQYLADRGHPTRLDSSPEELPTEGFIHVLGHGIGLDVHEAPWLGEGGAALVPGDVISIEPGVYYADLGGVRLEDLVLVTDDGYEVITDCSYDLEL